MRKDCDGKKLFFEGKLTDGYKIFGCKLDGQKTEFCVWAPHAKSVSVVGDFNEWDEQTDVLENDGGIWSIVLSGVKEFDAYKYCIITEDGRKLMKADPYAFHSETKEHTASKVYDLSGIAWSDAVWQKNKRPCFNRPMSIYEVHMGSWRRYEGGEYFDYRKLADELTEYVKMMQFTHVELMGVAEYPYDGSWGYQVTGYFAPTSRYGTPKDFAYLIDRMHANGIGVIMDWVPGHFPKDAHGLYEFDGQPLYEPSDELKKEHKEWGTRCFDYGRNEVKSFLKSNAVYWLKEFHIDGLRVDAVASMLYLDYGRQEWRPNKHGGKENLEAIEFLRELNEAVHKECPNCMMIAEESTAWPMVTMPPADGGLGFHFKWNMGWMNDSLSYVKTDPLFRKGVHNHLTFSMTYAYSENFILPISHDEVVHGKGSLINKMPGEYKFKFAGLRNYLMNMYAHPGKKLLFMGVELGQFTEWNYAKEVEWDLLQYDTHKSMQTFLQHLNGIYIEQKALFEQDDSWDGFEWLVADDSCNNVIVFQRKAKNGDKLLAVINFSPVAISDYCFGADKGSYTEILVSDAEGYRTKGKRHNTIKKASHGKDYSITMNILPMSGIYMVSKAQKKSSAADKPKANKTVKKSQIKEKKVNS